MREIKFRGWDVGFKEMESWESLLTSDVLPEVLQGVFPNLKLMQYTGQYDPTATEFCEGDIIKDHNDYWEVKFFDGAFWTVAIGGNAEPELLCGNDYMEIIGNIYENPELLEGNQ